jgi:hypothetical protein
MMKEDCSTELGDGKGEAACIVLGGFGLMNYTADKLHISNRVVSL